MLKMKKMRLHIAIGKSSEMNSHSFKLQGFHTMDNIMFLHLALTEFYRKKENIIIDLENISLIDPGNLQLLCYYIQMSKKNNVVVSIDNVNANLVSYISLLGFKELCSLMT